MTRAAIVAVLAIPFLTGGAAQQPPALTFHDLAAMTRWPFAGMQARGAMGQTGSFFIGDVPAGVKITPHHHHQEQVMLNLAGTLTIPLAGTPQSLPPLTAVVALANVQHGVLNGSGQPAVYLEFQPVLRPDWYPPHPRRPREGAPQPVPIPEGRKVIETFVAASDGWTTLRGARSKSLNGETAGVTVWDLPAASGPVDLTSGRAAERFVYVVDGDVAIAEDSTVRNVSREMLIIVAPSARNVRISAPRRSSATLTVFEAFQP